MKYSRAHRWIAGVTALLLSLQMVCPSVALAHDFYIDGGQVPSAPPAPQGGSQAPTNNPSHQDPNVQSQTDPLDIQRGEFTISRRDVVIPGGRGPSIDVSLIYRSRSSYNGPFGYGWDMSYNRRLRKLQNGNVLLLTGNNRKEEFRTDADLAAESAMSAQAPWALTNDPFAGAPATPFWTDSPGGNYADSANVSLTSPAFSLVGKSSPKLSFTHTFDLETNYDYGRVEISTNGTTWSALGAPFTGTQAAWLPVTIDLSAYLGNPNVQIRFRLTSDSSVTRDGWSIDGIAVTAVLSGATLMPPPGTYKTLTLNPNGTALVISKHGEKETYDVNGNLARLEDRNGQALTFTYDPAGLLPITGKSAYFVNQVTGVIGREYRLTQITDAGGHAVNFSYNGQGRLATITYAGRTITYGYDATSTGDLISVTTPATPEFPSGTTTRYTYTNHNLETIKDAKGQIYLTNVYDAVSDRVTQQTYGSGTSRLTYTDPLYCQSTPGQANIGFSLSLSPLVNQPGDTLNATWTAPAGSSSGDWIALYKTGDVNTSYRTYFNTSGAASGTGTFTTTSTYTAGKYEARYLINNGYTSVASSNTVCMGTATLTAAPTTPTDVIDRNGVHTRYEFDPAGHIIRMETFTDGTPIGEPASYVTTYEYNAAGERTRVVFPRGNSIESTYDAKGNLLEIRRKKIGMAKGVNDPSDLVTIFTYEPNYNFVKTVKDPKGNITTYTYDYEVGETMRGNLRKITSPTVDGLTPQIVFTYTAAGQIDTITDPTGNVTKHAYDLVTGYLTQVTRGFGTAQASTTGFGYDPVGNITGITDPRNNTTAFLYNALNQLTKITAPAPFSFLTYFTYDANGNLIHTDRQATTTAPGARPATGTVNPTDSWQSTVYTYTALDQVATVKDDLGHVTQLAYDATGNRTSIKDAKNQLTTFTYEERNLLWKVTDAATPAGITEYRYDPNGNLLSLADAKTNTTTYAYDGFDRLSKLTYPDTKHEDYGYDPNSNLTSRLTPASQSITYVYDALNRLRQKTIPGETATYTYDPANRLLIAANNAGTISHQYDPLGRLKQVTFPGSKVVAYGYDAASNRTSLIYPGSSPAITYAYDELSRLKSMTDLNTQSITYTYDALSRRGSLALPNGVTSTYGYDAINELLTLTHKKNTTTLSGVSYTYDELGNRKTQTTQPANTARSYTYDALSQLRTATNPAVAYAYDALGNRTTAAGTTYTANALNQYTQVGAVVPTYDLNGNLSGDGTATYTFNPENRLTQVVKGGITTTFTYDALGRRASKTVSGITTKFLYDGEDLLAETNSSGAVTGLYLHGPGIDEPLEIKRGSTTAYYSADGLGSIAHLTDTTGAIVESYTYDLFGQPTIKNGVGTVLSTSALGNPFLFTGREWDAETGLYYYRARYYQPTLGRFLSRDPLGYLPDANLYRYVTNNSLRFIDPFGLDKTPAWQRYGFASEQEYLDLLEQETGGAGSFWEDPTLNVILLASGISQAATALKGAFVGGRVLLSEAGFVGARRAVQQTEQQAVSKIKNILLNNFKPGPTGDIAGAVGDAAGRFIPKPGGSYYNHIEDLGSILRGLRKAAETLRGSTSAVAQQARGQALSIIRESEAAIKGLGI